MVQQRGAFFKVALLLWLCEFGYVIGVVANLIGHSVVFVTGKLGLKGRVTGLSF